MPNEDEGRDRGDASKPRTTKIPSKLPEARGETWNRFFQTATEGSSPADTSILDS